MNNKISIYLTILILGGCSSVDHYGTDPNYFNSSYLYNYFYSEPTYTWYDRSYADNTAKLNCREDGYKCKRIKRGESWNSLFPDKEKRKMVMSINRTNTSLWPGRRIKIPEDISSVQKNDLAPFPSYDGR